ncbi:DnaA/Hda family protein [Roseibium porphyridii]|uniref:DnaA/Hda family protein n=1 Tax=Roseibium porphyridii TaxID=2866279 RepID=A0ABY8EY37_9HYPH|nr:MULTISPECIES: DnaA/Hda family protein [Stappiaceae]QFT32672.1 Chromosomal replication initiator protein DnaA [Labrenzia sp. THAF82]WFE87997.1 DnaA/Hda family protein [Roseibium sp. KMA01]
MAEPPRQLPLDLPHEAALSRDDYLVGGSNRAAFELLERWPDWPSPVVVLAGPVGAGKTHLVNAFRDETGAAVVQASDLKEDDVELLASAPAAVVEDAHLGVDNTALFHLLNSARQAGNSVLITSRTWPASWKIVLPDLLSRLRAATPVEIQEPDDDLLRRVLVKLFADRQIAVEIGVIDYLVVRMERSLEVALRAVEAIDREALAGRVKITKPLAGRVLENVHKGQ